MGYLTPQWTGICANLCYQSVTRTVLVGHSTAGTTLDSVPRRINSTGPGSAGGPTDLNQVILDFARMQSAPKPTLDTFSGDPLDYTYFRMAFRDVVESCVPDQRGRLNRLLACTSGPAKDLVKTCVYCAEFECFDKAMELLHQEYGNKLMIARAHVKELKDQPSVKGSDPEAWKKLYRFLLKCKTFKATGHLKELDRPDIISVIITKLDPSFQDRWATLAEKVERLEEREVTFEDSIQFVQVQSSCVSALL